MQICSKLWTNIDKNTKLDIYLMFARIKLPSVSNWLQFIRASRANLLSLKRTLTLWSLKHFRCTSITYYFMLWKLRTMINATCEIRDISKSTIYQKHLPTFFKSKSFFICMRKKANETKLSLFCIPNKGFQKVLGYRQTPRFSDQTKLLLFSFLVRIWNDAMGL